MSDHRKWLAKAWHRGALIGLLTVVAALGPFASAPARAAQVMLQVSAAHGLLGFHHSALSRYLAAHMAEAGLADWRFTPPTGDAIAADRVEWSFQVHAYAGGEVRNFAGSLSHDNWVGARPVTIEARLYINGEYQTLVEEQVYVRSGPDDPGLGAAVVSVTRNLLGPQGAYRAIDLGKYPANHAK
jgi:hypothetical protein